MIQKIKLAVTALSLSLGLLAPLAVAGVASAALTPNNITTGLCSGVNDAAGAGDQNSCFNTDTSGTDSLKTIATKIINVFSVIVGIVAVVMIIYGGFRYITSGGDSGRVGNAKNTLIYAIVGLIIVALSQFLVHFVLTTTSTSVTGG
jgi:hypothetical protein